MRGKREGMVEEKRGGRERGKGCTVRSLGLEGREDRREGGKEGRKEGKKGGRKEGRK